MFKKINDPKFYQFIDKKFEKFKIPKNSKTMKEICFPKKYQFQIPQLFLSNFINPNTPYNKILIYHQIGAGKTCAAISIAENFKDKKKIYIVLPASLRGNFRTELRSKCAHNLYLTDNERILLKKYHPSSIEYKNIIEKSDEKINKYYNIYSYNKFIKLINNNELNLNNSVLIIDEIHNMISDNGLFYNSLYKLLEKSSDDLRLILLTATPIFDKPEEISLIMNLLIKKKENQLPIGKQFIDTFMNINFIKNEPVYQIKNLDIFKKKVKGYISYYRGAPPYVFPKSEIYIVKTKMSEYQKKNYLKIISKDLKNKKKFDYVNENISNSFFIGTRLISNIVFPNGKIGLKGFQSLKKNDFKLENMVNYSPKFVKILKKIKKCIGTIFIYSNFKEYGGIKSFTKFLEYHGYKDYQKFSNGKKRYAIWSSDQNNNLKDEIKAIFNDKKNIDGSQIKIICASPSAKEGVSFLRVREVHIIEPYWNWSRIAQIIGRAIRFCSHKDVPVDNRIVKVYIYISIHPEIKISINQYILHMALQKKKINNQFEQALKESAIDCELFKNGNIYSGDEKINCYKN